MGLRYFHDRTWLSDGGFVSLGELPGERGAAAKFLFVYLCLSPLRNAAGAFEVPVSTLAAHTSMRPARVRAALADLHARELLVYFPDFDVVWIPSAFIRYDSRSPNIVAAAFRDLDFLPAPVRAAVLKAWTEAGIAPPGKGSGRVRKGFGRDPDPHVDVVEDEDEEEDHRGEGGGEGPESPGEGRSPAPGGQGPARRAKTQGNGRGADPAAISAWIGDWNALAAETGLPGLRPPLSAPRLRALKARLRERPLADWPEVFAEIRRSRFLRGENDRGWRANPDFVLRPGSAEKILEGTYRGRAFEEPARGGFFAGSPAGATKRGGE